VFLPESVSTILTQPFSRFATQTASDDPKMITSLAGASEVIASLAEASEVIASLVEGLEMITYSGTVKESRLM
jgi:hypothetical protein